MPVLRALDIANHVVAALFVELAVILAHVVVFAFCELDSCRCQISVRTGEWTTHEEYIAGAGQFNSFN